MIEYNSLTEKQQKRYDRIVSIAEELMYKQGFYKLSLTELTKKLNVSRSTIYENFGSKEGLVEVIVKRYDQKIDVIIKEIVSDKKISSYDKFITIAEQLATSVEGKDSYRFLQDLKTHSPDLYAIYQKGRADREINCYKPLVDEGIKNGLFDKTLKPDFILQAYLKLAQMVCDTDIIEKSSITKSEAMVAIMKIFLNGAKKL